MKKTVLLIAVVLLALLAAREFWPNPKQAPSARLTDVVTTTSGDLRGYVQDNLNVYLGIPYAQPPQGDLRFKGPQPVAKWDGLFEAFEFGHVCPQVFDPVELEDPHEKTNVEDCLTLNIWSPGQEGDKKAVMVFIHGGGFVTGASKERLYQGDAIAKQGDVVYVDLNYREGLLGYLDFSALGGTDYADSANNGLRDQLLALQWVQDNIAAFGGDPKNVTVFGESAGGSSVSALLGIDNPQQYFKRAIVMSGSPHHSAADSAAIAKLISKETYISSPQIWKKLPTGALIYIQKRLLDAVGSPLSDLLFAPTYGEADVMKLDPIEAAKQGKTQGIDLMIGTMGNEISYWSFYDTKDYKICEQTVKDNLVTELDPAQEPQVQALYDLYKQNPERAGYTEGEIVLNIEDDYVFRVPALQLAEAQAKNGNVYYYRAEYPVNLPDEACQNNRAPHGSELPFVFGRINENSGTHFLGMPRDGQDTAVRERLVKQMIGAWTNFAKTGDPNGEGLPEWPKFDPGTQPTMRFGVDTHVEDAPFYAEYLAMAEFMKTFNVFDVFK